VQRLQESGLLERGGERSGGFVWARVPWSQLEWEIGVVFVALYVLLERLSFIHPWAPTGITPWNPQTALAVGFVLLRGVRSLPALFLAIGVAEFMVRVSPAPIGLALLGATALAVGYVAFGHALSKHLRVDGGMRGLREFAWTIGLTALAPLAIGAVYISLNALFGMVEWLSIPEVLLRFWIGDVVGVLALLPFLLALADRGGRRRLVHLVSRWETWLLFGSAVAILSVVYLSLPGGYVKYFFTLFLPVIWIAARYGLVGAAAMLALIQTGLILLVQVSDSGIVTVIELQARMLALSVTGLLLGVLVDERERAQERLRQSLRLAAAGEMAAALAHEVNQPLTALVSYGKACQHMLAQQPADTAQLTETVGKVTEQAQRVGAIVKRLRDFLRSGTMNLEWVVIGDFLETMRAASRVEARAAGIELRLQVEPELPKVLIDRIELEIVLRNLIANAMDSIREAKPIKREIRLEVTNLDPGFLRVGVIDSGPGVSPQMRERLFTPFSTSKSHGMGLGLAISRAIVMAHGGRLTAEPTAYGAFYLTLPTRYGETDDSDA